MRVGGSEVWGGGPWEARSHPRCHRGLHEASRCVRRPDVGSHCNPVSQLISRRGSCVSRSGQLSRPTPPPSAWSLQSRGRLWGPLPGGDSVAHCGAGRDPTPQGWAHRSWDPAPNPHRSRPPLGQGGPDSPRPIRFLSLKVPAAVARFFSLLRPWGGSQDLRCCTTELRSLP